VLALADALPGLRRIDLTVNYRCPRPVVDRAVRLVANNEERFVKTIRAGPAAEGRLVLAPDGADETVRIRHVFERWPDDGRPRAILARTNAELLPAAAVALEMGLPFRAPRLRLLSEDRRVDAIIDAAAAIAAPGGDAPGGDAPGGDAPLPRLAALAVAGLEALALPATSARPPRGAPADADDREVDELLPLATGELLAAVIGWAAPYRTLAELASAVDRHRARIGELRRDDALLTLATAHSTKGLEFDHVAVIGLDAGRFPSARSIREAPEPGRALEEERRLAYVAWTRARRSLTLVFDPAAPSPFLLEAFSDAELSLDGDYR